MVWPDSIFVLHVNLTVFFVDKFVVVVEMCVRNERANGGLRHVIRGSVASISVEWLLQGGSYCRGEWFGIVVWVEINNRPAGKAQ